MTASRLAIRFVQIAILGMAPLLSTGASARCLAKQNDSFSLRQSMVHQNGRLKLRFDWWGSGSGSIPVTLRSNSPAFNGEFSAAKIANYWGLVLVDRHKLCSTVELKLNCAMDESEPVWWCTVSEF
jgi:hypothetical protein